MKDNQTKLFTDGEWKSLSAESRHRLNVWITNLCEHEKRMGELVEKWRKNRHKPKHRDGAPCEVCQQERDATELEALRKQLKEIISE